MRLMVVWSSSRCSARPLKVTGPASATARRAADSAGVTRRSAAPATRRRTASLVARRDTYVMNAEISSSAAEAVVSVMNECKHTSIVPRLQAVPRKGPSVTTTVRSAAERPTPPNWRTELADSLLEAIDGPEALRSLDAAELAALAAEIREVLIEAVSVSGGHLGSNLGAVELTLALHRVFDSPRDAIVWDTGHQSYVHKLVTGRLDGFSRLRQGGGMSGLSVASRVRARPGREQPRVHCGELRVRPRGRPRRDPIEWG